MGLAMPWMECAGSQGRNSNPKARTAPGREAATHSSATMPIATSSGMDITLLYSTMSMVLRLRSLMTFFTYTW